MTVAQVTKVKTKGLPSSVTVGPSEVFEYTIKVRQWTNRNDRPNLPEISAAAIDPETREQLIDWLREVN